MPTARAWLVNNDMQALLSEVRSSTMSSTAYLNSSLGVKVSVWASPSTTDASKRLVNAASMSYVAGSNGVYRYVAQSTSFGALSVGVSGLAIMTLSTGGLNGEWRVPVLGEYRGTS